MDLNIPMIHTQTYSRQALPSIEEEIKIVHFLHQHLENYGDPIADIQKCVDYALQRNDAPGGLLIASYDAWQNITGAVIINKTGMQGYIPENILVYIATHHEHRGKGIGKQLMTEAISQTDGDIALHVEPENPAKALYERLGFTNKYLEMRLKK